MLYNINICTDILIKRNNNFYENFVYVELVLI